MKQMIPIAVAGALLATAAVPGIAQGYSDPRRGFETGTVVQQQPNTTGNNQGVVISRGATGADTFTSNSAAGGNASLPERAIPNGSGGGGTGSR